MSEIVFSSVVLEKNNRILAMLVVGLLIVAFVLLFGIIQVYQKPPIVVYTHDGQIHVLDTKTLQMDETLLKDFIKMIAGQYLSFTADSLPQQIEGIRPYLAPKPIEAILNSFKNNQAIIEKQNISQQFVINSISITKANNPFWIEVEGIRNINAAGNNKSIPMTYVFEVKKVNPIQSNPYGFLMTDIIEKDKIINKGQAK